VNAKQTGISALLVKSPQWIKSARGGAAIVVGLVFRSGDELGKDRLLHFFFLFTSFRGCETGGVVSVAAGVVVAVPIASVVAGVVLDVDLCIDVDEVVHIIRGCGSVTGEQDATAFVVLIVLRDDVKSGIDQWRSDVDDRGEAEADPRFRRRRGC